ncbi:MAG TPA: FAD-dependent oxidoreductase, partial [Spirochaetales bacterium]|nr:FAD-dependent oxidoreductase [Spirochaetales bacterium]
MRVIIVGGGMIGVHIARELIAEKRDVVIIEKDAERSRVVSNELDCMVINDDGCSADVIMKAGASSSAWFLALTGSDEVNMVSCGLAAAGSPGINTVARVANPFYSALSSGQLKALGVGSVIDPSRETA